mmetsp:Transcript_46528/g.129685  ORF Transcript_46528/g.129685 Transcript_46528/m.129685 type:complete len:462 (-) Transcript_46528:180-1565(-)
MSWFLKSAAITLLTLAPPPRVNAFLRAAPAAVSRRPSRREAESSSDTSGAAASRVVILGGGFGGLYTALRLAEFSKEQPVEITLVDSKDKFVFLPLLYELTTGQAPLDEVAPTFDSLLANTNVKFMQGEVDGIDVGGNVVSVGGVDVPFDRCVVALGGEPLKDTVPGAAENALAFYTLEDAYQLQRELARLDTAPGDVRVVVVGGSYSGVELATSIASRLGSRAHLTLVERGDEVLGRSPPHNVESAKAALASAKVDCKCATSVLRVGAGEIVVCPNEDDSAATTLDADLVLWTAGSRPNAMLGGLAGVTCDAAGRLVVDNTLRVQSPEGRAAGGVVFALGDNAVLELGPLPPNAQVAFQQSEYAAWNVWASLNDEKPLAFRYTALGEMLTLGANDASVAGPQGLEALKLSGPLAAAARRLVYAARMPTSEQRVKAGVNWLQSPAKELLRLAQETRLNLKK